MFGKINQAKCIVCEKKIKKDQAINKYDLYFCCEECLKEYEEHLKKIDKEINLDNCC